MLLFLILMFKILFVEARVFCQDNNALTWKPLGFPCPITCGTIKMAVQKLKHIDYQILLQENKENISESEINKIHNDLDNNAFNARKNSLDERKHLKLYQTYHRLLTNENFEHALKKEAEKLTDELKKSCNNMASRDFLKKVVNVKCFRRLNKRGEVLEKFTKFLNLFADPMYPFDEEMAGTILQKLEGNLNLRYGVVDYKRILAYLRQALNYHRLQSKGERIIKLQSKNCMSVFMSGCFCRTGYVENENECVKPEDCISNPALTEHLERIVIF